jgi:hypothetical protein
MRVKRWRESLKSCRNFPHVAPKTLLVCPLVHGKNVARFVLGSGCFTISLPDVPSSVDRQDLMTTEALILASLCAGIAAGVRLRVFVLFPLIFLCLIVVTAWGVAQNQTVWSIIVMNFVGSTCLQLGYLAGTLPSFIIFTASQGRRERPQPVRPLLN